MGSTPSVMSGVLAEEAAKPGDGSDVSEDPLAEVVRLRAIIKEAAASSVASGPEEAASTDASANGLAPPAPPLSSSFVPKTITSASETLRLIHSKETSCVDVVKAALERITATEEIKACCEVLGESALALAEQVDAKIAAGGELGALEGLPIVVKANINGPVGSLTTASTPAMADWRPIQNAPCVDKLLAAGAIPIAKTNMPQLALGVTAER